MSTLSFEDYQAISSVKSRYFRCIDTKQWAALRELFVDDATFDGLWATAADPDAFVSNLQRNLPPEVITIHQGYMPDLVQTAPGVVRGIWTMMDYLLWPTDTKQYLGVSVPGQRGIKGYGHYEEEYHLVDGVWKIAKLRLSRLRIDPVMAPEPPMPDFQFARLLPDWLGS